MFGQIQKTVDVETKKFRDRSARRVAMVKKKQGTTAAKKKTSNAPKAAATKSLSSEYIPMEILERMPEYIQRLVPQINGAYDKEWYEASAMVLRRLVETLIIELYSRRGWTSEVQDPYTREFQLLKTLIDKINGDKRLHMQRRTIEGLNKVKELGDTAAHDFDQNQEDRSRPNSVGRSPCHRETYFYYRRNFARIRLNQRLCSLTAPHLPQTKDLFHRANSFGKVDRLCCHNPSAKTTNTPTHATAKR